MEILGPFARHLKDAIEINLKRSVPYAKLSRGRSLRFSAQLVLSEQISLPFALGVDRLTLEYRKQGIPIGDLEYISMEKIPPFSERYPFEVEPLSQFVREDGNLLKKRLSEAFRSGGYPALRSLAQSELLRLEKPRAYHCMVRHLLESIIRLAVLAPLHAQFAKEKGVQGRVSCDRLSRIMLWGNLVGLPACADFDAAIAPLQSTGIPILFQDVPAIPSTCETYPH